jgi:hypothetical protein
MPCRQAFQTRNTSFPQHFLHCQSPTIPTHYPRAQVPLKASHVAAALFGVDRREGKRSEGPDRSPPRRVCALDHPLTADISEPTDDSGSRPCADPQPPTRGVFRVQLFPSFFLPPGFPLILFTLGLPAFETPYVPVCNSMFRPVVRCQAFYSQHLWYLFVQRRKKSKE